MTTALLLGIALFCGILIPFLYKEIRRGKAELGPELIETNHGVEFGAITPTGAGDNHAGNRRNPAPDQPDAQADPYGPDAQKNAPPIKS
jgi:hypothetical protein